MTDLITLLIFSLFGFLKRRNELKRKNEVTRIDEWIFVEENVTGALLWFSKLRIIVGNYKYIFLYFQTSRASS